MSRKLNNEFHFAKRSEPPLGIARRLNGVARHLLPAITHAHLSFCIATCLILLAATHPAVCFSQASIEGLNWQNPRDVDPIPAMTIDGRSVWPQEQQAVAAENAKREPATGLSKIDEPIVVSARDAANWREGEFDIWYLSGPFKIQQGNTVAQSHDAILLVDQGDPYLREPDRVIAYLEGSVAVDFLRTGEIRPETELSAQSIRDQAWLGRFVTQAGLQFNVIATSGRPTELPPIYQRAIDYQQAGLDPNVRPTQFSVPMFQDGVPVPQPQAPQPVTDFSINRRWASVDFTSYIRPDPTTGEMLTFVDRGVRITIRSSELGEYAGELGALQSARGPLDTVTIQADRAIIWTNQFEGLSDQAVAGPERREIYLEGNIVFSYAERVIFADRMYYDVNNRRGTILNAEMLTPVPEYEGLVRLKAEVIQQLSQDEFKAYQAAFTSSRLGFPRYWVQSGELDIRHEQVPRVDPRTGALMVDRSSGSLMYDHRYDTRSNNNFVYVSGVPVFYWPSLRSDLSDPVYYIKSLSFKNDGVYGTQVLSRFDLYQILGIGEPPEGSEWSLDVDYLSDRGFGLGTEYLYEGTNLFGFSGPYRGRIDAWGINDNGVDNLGLDRRSLVPEEDFRGRVFAQHRQDLDNGFQFSAELGLISDRNFLEQYYEQEWDQNKDQTTGLQLKRIFGNQSINVSGNVRLNDFFLETEWVPRLDHFIVGQPLLLDRLSWTAHTHAGYGRVRTADAPQDPVDAAKFRTLPWEAEVQGVRAGTRQGLEMPISFGPGKLVPYAIGDLTYWEEDLNQQSVTRTYGQVGARASVPIFKVDPTVQSELLNIDGLAHKATFNVDTYYADVSEDIGRFALYDPLDDNAQERFRRRFGFDTFLNGVVPLQFDERNFAFRRNMQGYVTSPTTEIADDVLGTRVGINQRWQTKRGWSGQKRVVDWVEFDVGGTVFPDADEHNFGVETGLVDYDFTWNLGDRVAILSDGYFDFFGDGLRTASVGLSSNRPELGSFFIGMRSIEGPISANILSGSVSYLMSDKWILTAGTSLDFGQTGNIGQTFRITRIGESFLVRLGVNVDASRGNIGAVLGIEPRFYQRDRSGGFDGIYIPPPGTRGVE